MSYAPDPLQFGLGRIEGQADAQALARILNAPQHDGRRALAYINKEAGTAQLVLVLRPDDLIKRGAQLAQGQPIPPEDKLLKDILDLRDDEPEAPSLP